MAPKKMTKSVKVDEVSVEVEGSPDVVVALLDVVTTTADSTPLQSEVVDIVVAKDKFVEILETLQSFQNNLKELVSVVKVLQKEHVKLVKQKSKKTSKKQVVDEVTGVATVKRQPSGFAKPTKLSDDLCDFLGVPHDTLMARTDVTRDLNNYIKANNLQDPNDRRKIIPDTKLKTILALTDGVPLTYFSLQSSISRRRLKKFLLIH